MKKQSMFSGLKPMILALAAASSLLPGLASATLGDTPVWNLWDASTFAGGDGDTVSICGTADCAITSDSTDPLYNAAAANAGVAQFSVFTQQPAGSGYIDPFLRLQHTETGADSGDYQTYCASGQSCGGASGGVEAAYNTNDDNLQDSPDFINQAKDTTAGGTPDFNHAVRIGDLVADENGNYAFYLDVNEPGEDTARTILLQELEFFVSTRDDLNYYTPQQGQSEGAEINGGSLVRKENGVEVASSEKVWDLDFDNNPGADCATPGDAATAANGGQGCGGIRIDSRQGSAGSGDFDMQVLLSASLFQVGDDWQNSYVYLYSYFGEADRKTDNVATAGFEEWKAVVSTEPRTSVAEPGTLAVLGLGLAGFIRVRRRSGR